MKYVLPWLVLAGLLMVTACRKTGFIDSPDAAVSFSADTLHFDTVFTATGSVTQSFKIFNNNDRKLKLAAVSLGGGNASYFKMNVDGTAGASVSNVEIAPNDSVYVFVSVTINPSADKLPFVVQDSVVIDYNGTKRFVQLEAYGQNARFLRNQHVTTDSTWTSELPIVILGGVTVDSSVTLTVNKGSRVFCHADAPVIVNGSLQVRGEVGDDARVTFAGDRLDDFYRDIPGTWPGIYFNSSSTGNRLTYAVIKNAYQGIITVSSIGAFPKIALDKCIIDNIYDAGIISIASTIKATNCLISNCGTNLGLTGGGDYAFDYCTVASYENQYLQHKNPVLYLSDFYDTQVFPLSALFRNCIFYGSGGLTEDEVVVERKGTDPNNFDVAFQNVLYKNKSTSYDALFVNSIKNEPPAFDTIDLSKNVYDFHLKPMSPARNKGQRIAGLPTDIEGNVRSAQPNLGCYEQ